MDFDSATEYEFKCPECGELLFQIDSQKIIDNLQKPTQEDLPFNAKSTEITDKYKFKLPSINYLKSPTKAEQEKNLNENTFLEKLKLYLNSDNLILCSQGRVAAYNIFKLLINSNPALLAIVFIFFGCI